MSEDVVTGGGKKIFANALDFSMFIETTAIEEGISCVQALVDFCDDSDIDPDAIAKHVSKQLKEKLAVEYANMGLLKKSPSLYD